MVKLVNGVTGLEGIGRHLEAGPFHYTHATLAEAEATVKLDRRFNIIRNNC